MVRTILWMACVALLIAVGDRTARSEEWPGVGLQRLEVVDPVGGGPMDAVAFYPSPSGAGPTSIGPFDVDGARDAAVAAGRHPLVLLSHGNGGSLWGHHDLASFLAHRGFVVVTVSHPGDNFRDPSGAGGTGTIYGRPMQISAALDAVLRDPVLASRVDAARIGFVGYSAGGTTGLLLAGAKPDFQRLVAYCAARPRDHHVCVVGGRIRDDRPDLQPAADPRIQALVLMAPLGVVFPPAALSAVRIPVLIAVATRDQRVGPSENGLALAAALPGAEPVLSVPQAGHFVFLAPCSARLARSAPELCTDPAGVDRVAVHADVNRAIDGFLAARLGAAR